MLLKISSFSKKKLNSDLQTLCLLSFKITSTYFPEQASNLKFKNLYFMLRKNIGKMKAGFMLDQHIDQEILKRF